MIRTDDNPKRRHDLALICGDGRTLPQELQLFSLVGVPHDTFCCGRSLQCYIPFVTGGSSIINYVWLDEQMFSYARDQVDDYVVRHSVFFDPKLKPAIDALWTDNGYEIVKWAGSSAFFALKVALAMGYERIVLAGVPINAEPHWYDAADQVGPQWTPETLQAWGRFRKNGKHRERIRSCSGYTQYLFGEPKIGWLKGKAEANTGANRSQDGRGPIAGQAGAPG